MLVNKIHPRVNYSPNFKSRRYETDERGNNGVRFNYLYESVEVNPENQTTAGNLGDEAYVHFYKVVKDDSAPYGYRLASKKEVHGVKLEKGGTFVNLDKIPNLEPGEPVAYKYQVNYKNTHAFHYVDSDKGIDLGEGYILLHRDGTTPVTNGSALALMHDNNRIAHFDNNGHVVYDVELQREKENIEPSYATRMGGNIAGLIRSVDDFGGVTVIAQTPIWGSDTHTPHGYNPENIFQISPSVGNTEQFRAYISKLFLNGKMYQHDGTFTSESAYGNRFQNGVRHYKERTLDYFRYTMNGIEDYPVSVGVLPQDEKNIRIKFVNSPILLDGKKNLRYDSSKETYVQIYDSEMVTDEQKNDTENLINTYDKPQKRDELRAGTFKDVTIHDYFRCEPFMAERAIKGALDKKISFDTPESVFYVMDNFTDYTLSKNSKGFIEWESMAGLASIAYQENPQFRKFMDKFEPAEKEKMQKMREYAIVSNLDLAMQNAKYIFQFIKDSQIMTILDTLRGKYTISELREGFGNLPDVAQRFKDEAIENIINGNYKLQNFREDSKDETTIKALMDLPLEAIPFAPSTVSVLSCEYMSNMAISKEDLGKTRYELMKDGNPQLLDDWTRIYKNTEDLFTKHIKSFTDKVIEVLDKESAEKLLVDGDYTEYGAYVLNLIGKEITKYALLKSLMGNDLKPQVLEGYNGFITYNYDEIREKTSLQALNINEGVTLKSQANNLQGLIEDGLRGLSNDDVEFLVKTFKKQFEGTNTLTFRLAHAVYNVAGLGGNIRLDAAKNIIDINAVKNKDMNFEDAQDAINRIWTYVRDAIKTVNPHANIAAELTDYGDIFQSAHGAGVNGYKEEYHPFKDAFVDDSKYKGVEFVEGQFKGITSTYEYYLYSELLHTFARDFDSGNKCASYNGDDLDKADKTNYFMKKLKKFLTIKSLDYTNFRPIFFDNHDKPSAIHAMALDMGLFFNNAHGEDYIRRIAMQILMNQDEILPSLNDRLHDPDYFKTVSYKAVAVSKLFRDIIVYELEKPEKMDSAVYENLVSCMKQATADLANGNYKGSGKNIDFTKIPVQESSPESMRLKNEYGVQDFRSVISKIFEQSKYIAKSVNGMDDEAVNKMFEFEDEIYADLFIKSTAPAVQKALQMASVMVAIPGMPMVFLRDMLCGLGFEEKTWNVYLKMRGMTNWSELESKNPKIKDYIAKVFDSFKNILSIRGNIDAEPLNYGNPYFLENNKHIKGILMHDADDSMTISLMNFNMPEDAKEHKFDYYWANGTPEEGSSEQIDKGNRFVPYNKKDEVSTISLVASGLGAAAIAENTVFNNIGNLSDKTKYIVKKIAGELCLVAENADKISFSNATTIAGSANRVMILARKVPKIRFKGHQINKQYNIVSNPYQQKETVNYGKNLSIIVK